MAVARGFVGPLGDDIPSIFPIIAGVLLFISTVAYVTMFISEKDSYLDTRKAALGLAYIVTKQGATTLGELESSCANVIQPYAKSRGVSFAVVLKKFCRKIALNAYPFDWRTYAVNPLTNEEEIGGQSDVEGGVCVTPGISSEELANPENMPLDAIILNYPIAVHCPNEGSMTTGLGMVNVMVWRSYDKLEKASGLKLK